MDIRNRRALKQTAAQSLAGAPGQPKQAALAYAGIAAALSLLTGAVNLLVSNRIAGTGGLANMGLRSILSTIQSILPLVQMLIVMGLGLGYQAAALKMSRRQESSPKTLLDGFYRFGPLFRMSLLQTVIYMAIAFVGMYVSIQIFIMTPLASDLWEVLTPILSSVTSLDSEIVLDEATLSAASMAMWPVFPIFAVLFLAAAAPIFYQYRMANFCLLDASKPGAITALRESRGMMRRNRFQLFKLDLSFWWFYLLELLVTVICYGDMLLPLLGVTLPWSDTVSYFLFYTLSLALQVGVYYLYLNRVNVTYATAYEALRNPPQQTNKVVLGNIFDM